MLIKNTKHILYENLSIYKDKNYAARPFWMTTEFYVNYKGKYTYLLHVKNLLVMSS